MSARSIRSSPRPIAMAATAPGLGVRLRHWRSAPFCYSLEPRLQRGGGARGHGQRVAGGRQRKAGSPRIPLARTGCALVLAAAAQAQVAPTREEVQRPPLERERAAARAADRRGRGRAGALRARPARISRHPLHRHRRRCSTICAASRAEDLRPAYAPYLGQEHPIAVICEIRDRAATILRDAGYVAAVEVPEQRITDGTVRFQVLMAKLVGLRVRGDAGRSERAIARYLGAADRARGVQPLRGRALSAARRRPARLRRPAGAALGRGGARRGDRRGDRRPPRRPGRSSPSRISARASSAAGARWSAASSSASPASATAPPSPPSPPPTRPSSRRCRSPTISGSAARASPSAASSPTPGPAPISTLPGVDDRFAHPLRDARGELSRSSAGRRGRCAARSASTSSTRTSTSTTSR